MFQINELTKNKMLLVQLGVIHKDPHVEEVDAHIVLGIALLRGPPQLTGAAVVGPEHHLDGLKPAAVALQHRLVGIQAYQPQMIMVLQLVHQLQIPPGTSAPLGQSGSPLLGEPRDKGSHIGIFGTGKKDFAVHLEHKG